MRINRDLTNSIKSPIPFPRSYWVIPGLLLAGAYPGAKDANEAEEKLSGLLNVGIRKILSA